MKDGSPSETALMVALMRARHYLSAPEPKILRDNIAMPLSGAGSEDEISQSIEKLIAGLSMLSDRKTAEEFVLRIEHSVCMRSRLVEERLKAGIDYELGQLVILGAGLDSTAYRMNASLSNFDVFEIDHPSTQKWKRERLDNTGIEIPPNLKFVGFDFEQQTLAESLEKGGVDTSKITLFAWLGVHMYLTDDAVKSTLDVLGKFPENSELVMDFIQPDYAEMKGYNSGPMDQMAASVASMGEPFKSLYTKDELRKILNDSGFGDVVYHESKELADIALDGNRNAYALPDGASSILSARIKADA